MQPTKSSAEAGTAAEQYKGFTAEERAAMKEHAQEQKKAAARRGSRGEGGGSGAGGAREDR